MGVPLEEHGVAKRKTANKKRVLPRRLDLTPGQRMPKTKRERDVKGPQGLGASQVPKRPGKGRGYITLGGSLDM